MGGMSLMHWLVVAVLVILLFGGSRFSNMMGDVAKGIKNFKKGMAEDEEAKAAATRIEGKPVPEPIVEPATERAREEQR